MSASQPESRSPQSAMEHVEMPRPTAAPLVLALGMSLLAVGVLFGVAFYVVGAVVLIAGLGIWIAQLLPGRGHFHEPVVEAVHRPRPVTGVAGGVAHLGANMPGYRLRLPEDVHPISAGFKGGIAGAVAMPVPALIWGLVSHHSLWYPVNLLAGILLPVPGHMSAQELDEFLKQFHGWLLLFGIAIHVVISVVFGLIYGVLLPTLPTVPRPIAWGGLVMPVLWTGASYVAMSLVNPALPGKVTWPWFIVSQFVFGVTMPAVVLGLKRWPPLLAGAVGGLAGGAAMAVPALLWAATSGHGLWYPVNLLAGMVWSGPGSAGAAELGSFHAEWFLTAVVMHAILSTAFGVLFALTIPQLRPIPAPVAWGGLVLPLLWTGVSYGLMGVVNPVLQDRVDWAWFILSQFVFGVTAAVVVLRSELVHIPPAGRGPDRVTDFVAGEGGGQSG
jgi:hypothetical protein